MYKMVSPINIVLNKAPSQTSAPADLPTNRVGWTTHQSLRSFLRRRPGRTPPTGHLLSSFTHHLQRLSVRRPPLEIHTSAARSSGFARRDGTGLLHGHEQKRGGHHWGGHLQRHTGPGGTLLQQNPMFLFRRAEAERRRNGGYAGFLLHRSRFCQRPGHEGH